MAITGRAFVTHTPPETRGHISPFSVRAAAAMPFAQSIVEPPPAAITTSIFSFLHIAAPLLTVECLGLGSTPEISKSSMPLFFAISVMVS